MAEPIPEPDPGCSEEEKKCQTTHERLCKDYFCDGGKKRRIFPNQRDQKEIDRIKKHEPLEDPEKYYGSACCEGGMGKNKKEITIGVKYTAVIITLKLWPSVLTRNTLSCVKEKDKCKLDELSGYTLLIGASPNPQDPENEKSILQGSCPGVVGEYNGDNTTKQKNNKIETLRFPISIPLKNIPKIDPETITNENICNPIVYELVNMLVPVQKIYQRDADDPLNPKSELEKECAKYFYPNMSESGLGELRDGAQVVTEDGKVTQYLINCETNNSNNLCSMLTCMDSEQEPGKWDDENKEEGIVTYSQLSVKLVSPDSDAQSICSDPIPVGLTLISKDGGAAVTTLTTINGVIDVGTPCEGFTDSENRPQYPNPQIDGGASGRIITIGGKPYIDNRTIVKICRSKNPEDLMTCEKISDPDCNCSSFTPNDYNNLSEVISSITNPNDDQKPSLYEPPYKAPKFSTGGVECQWYICNTCERLSQSRGIVNGKVRPSIKDEYCAGEFDNSRECWVCSPKAVQKISYKEFCEKKSDDNLSFLGWVDELKQEDAVSQCFPSVSCCTPDVMKKCWYGAPASVANKKLTIKYELANASLSVPLQNSNKNLTIGLFDSPTETQTLVPGIAKEWIYDRFISKSGKYQQTQPKSTSLKIAGCSCEGDSSNFRDPIITAIRNNLKTQILNYYTNYFSLVKDTLSYAVTSYDYIRGSGLSRDQKQTYQKQIIFENASSLINSSDASLNQSLKSIIENDTMASKKSQLSQFLNTFMNLDEEKLTQQIDSAVSSLSIDCKNANATIEVKGMKVTISQQFVPPDKTEDTKCVKPYVLKSITRSLYSENPNNLMTTEAQCNDQINEMKNNGFCCIKNNVFAVGATMDENGTVTAVETSGKCKTISPEMDGLTLKRSASDICVQDNKIFSPQENKWYPGKVLDNCDSCDSYDPQTDPDNDGHDMDENDPDPNVDNNPNPDTNNPPEPEPCKKMIIKISNGQTVKAISKDIKFPITVNILNGDNESIEITANTYDDLNVLISGGSLDNLDAIANAKLTEEQFRTRILAQIFGVDINDTTVINTGLAYDCGSGETNTDPNDPLDPKLPCSQAKSELSEVKMKLDAINSRIASTNDRILDEENGAIIERLKARLESLKTEQANIQQQLNKLQDRVNECQQNN